MIIIWCLLIALYMTLALSIFLVMNLCVSGNLESKKTGEIIEVGTPKYILIMAFISVFWPVLMIKYLIERSFK